MNYTIFGESHGPAIGVTLTGVPAGLELAFRTIQQVQRGDLVARL